MNNMVQTESVERLAAATAIAHDLPEPDYGRNFQVAYEPEALVGAIAENLGTPGVATPRDIDDLSEQIAAVAAGGSHRPIVITNSCAEDIYLQQPIQHLGAKTVAELEVIDESDLVDPIVIQRLCGQFVKPRSEMLQSIDGQKVFSYMGDGINGKDADDRKPDPSRLVAGAVQSRALQEYLAEAIGGPVLTAHEALSLAYELPFRREDPETGKTYLESAHLPWVGLRTNQAQSEQARLLGSVENPVGVKIGGNSDVKHIADIAKILNPEGLPGKIVFMMRLAQHETKHLTPILHSIRHYASDPVILYDIHGVTKTREDGRKIRLVGDIVSDIEQLAYACDFAGLRLNGVHLETTADKERIECVDSLDQDPQPGCVDPRLNRRQTQFVLDAAAPYIQ